MYFITMIKVFYPDELTIEGSAVKLLQYPSPPSKIETIFSHLPFVKRGEMFLLPLAKGGWKGFKEVIFWQCRSHRPKPSDRKHGDQC